MFDPRSPIFLSRLPDLHARRCAIDEKARDPLGAGMGVCGAVRAQTTSTPACAPLVTHAFDPETTKPSAVIVADVCMPPDHFPRRARRARTIRRHIPRKRASGRARALGVGPIEANNLGHHVGDRHGDRGRRAPASDLDHGQRVGDTPGLGAAERRGHVHAHHPQLGEPANLALGKALALVDLGRHRAQLFLRKVARRPLNQLLTLGEGESISRLRT